MLRIIIEGLFYQFYVLITSIILLPLTTYLLMPTYEMEVHNHNADSRLAGPIIHGFLSDHEDRGRKPIP